MAADLRPLPVRWVALPIRTFGPHLAGRGLGAPSLSGHQFQNGTSCRKGHALGSDLPGITAIFGRSFRSSRRRDRVRHQPLSGCRTELADPIKADYSPSGAGTVAETLLQSPSKPGTELAQTYPLHVVCTWIGNTERIAA